MIKFDPEYIRKYEKSLIDNNNEDIAVKCAHRQFTVMENTIAQLSQEIERLKKELEKVKN